MKLYRILLLAALAAPLTFTSAFAAGSDSEPTADVTECEKNEVYDKEKKECVEEEKSSLNDADLLDNGRALAYAGRFEEAVSVLNKIEDQNTPEVQNYLGFSSRKSGNVEKGLAHYRAALKLDPDYVLARSYMGQALLNKGNRSGAIIQLSEIETRVGKDAREYKMLAASIERKDKYGTSRY